MNLSDENALALFITPLLMAISDRTTSILLRLKMLGVVWSGMFIMTLGVAFFCHTILGIILFMFVLVRAAYYFSFRFPPKNLFFTIVLLGFSFFLPLNLNLDTVPYFLFWMFIGGLVYVSSLLLGYLIYLYFSGNRALNWANFFEYCHSFKQKISEGSHFFPDWESPPTFMFTNLTQTRHLIFDSYSL